MNRLKTYNKQTSQRGTTLIELSVVIAVILLLVGVLFIGVTAWKNGANQAACIVNIATIQKAVRGYQNMNNLNAGVAVTMPNLVTAAFFAVAPTCPTNAAAYTVTGTIPVPGVAYATCPNKHVPATTANW
jgi:prepilin-type N-terminal cleavage/methylation domain-containing protein